MTLIRCGHMHTQKKKVDFAKKIRTLEREQKQKRKSDREGKLETNLREKDERVKEPLNAPMIVRMLVQIFGFITSFLKN